MDPNYDNPILAAVFTALSLVAAFFAVILEHVEVLVRIGAGVFAMASAFMAIRYYHYATKEKKESLKNLKQ